MTATSERVRLRNPDKTKGGASIDRKKYELVRKAVLALVPRTAPGISWTSLRDAADKRLGRKLEGSKNWWCTTAVKLHLEAIGEPKSSKGSPQPLTRTK